MLSNLNDTIVALATAVGESAIAVVRMSGAEAFAITDTFFRSSFHRSIEDAPARTVLLGTIECEGQVLDNCLVLPFHAPNSYTGEHIVEFHLHGNPVIVERMISLAVAFGARAATPGEFTRRAFVNGKMDLIQAESVAAIIAGESQQAVFLAQRQHQGQIGHRLMDFRASIITTLSRLELELDFVEDGYSFLSVDETRVMLEEMIEFVEGVLSGFPVVDRLVRGPRILLLGRPNAGKSSLFNALLGYSRALVSPVEGTTRDYLEERVTYSGLTFRIMDTAGIRHVEDDVESEGIQKARELVELSDLVLYLIDSSDPSIASSEVAEMQKLMATHTTVPFLTVWSKWDLRCVFPLNGIRISVNDSTTLSTLLDRLVQQFSVSRTGELALLNRRQYNLLSTCLMNLRSAVSAFDAPTEVLSAELRTILYPLGELTGEIANEEILNSVFSSFCIGK